MKVDFLIKLSAFSSNHLLFLPKKVHVPKNSIVEITASDKNGFVMGKRTA